MEINETLQELTPIADGIGGFSIKNFDSVKQVVLDYIGGVQHKDLVITDKGSLKVLKDSRTELRKNLKLVKDIRLSFDAMLLPNIHSEFKELETALDEADKEMKSRVDAYEESLGKTAKPKIITLEVKGYDLNKLKVIQEMAIQAGLIAVIKE